MDSLSHSGSHVPALLGVTQSVTDRRWVSRLDAAGDALALQIAQAHGVSDVLARILASRSVLPELVPVYLEPRLRDLMPDPSTLTDMDAAAARLAQAVTRDETVGIFGDYDVDGACSSALLALFLRAHGVPFHIHIPDRIIEGYGPNAAAIEALAPARRDTARHGGLRHRQP